MSDFKRQAALFDPLQYKDAHVTLIGVGGIGSGVLMGLAKMGITNITVYDDDLVETHNMPNQFYCVNHIGQPKVTAAAEIAKEFSPDEIDIKAINEKASYLSDIPENSIIIFAMDSLEARKELFLSRFVCRTKHVIDARMGGNVISVYNVDLDEDENVATYAETLHAVPHKTPCAAQAISYTILLTAGLVCSSVRNILVGNKNPFNVALDAQNFMLQAEVGATHDTQPERESVTSGVQFT
jgi:molybdopterin/thiamine biosynthesis adenylyltransferase